VSSLFEPSSLRDPSDGSYWTIIHVIPTLKPELSLEDASYVTLRLANAPPTPNHLVDFPQQLVNALKCVDNSDILDEEINTRVLEYQIYPPDRKQQYIRKVHKAGDPTHHVLIHWRPLAREEEARMSLY